MLGPQHLHEAVLAYRIASRIAQQHQIALLQANAPKSVETLFIRPECRFNQNFTILLSR
jgi:hypothetical protein